MTAPIQSTHPLRLHLSPDPGTGVLDGAWWPRSHDLETELADLVDQFPAEVGRVRRVLFSRPDWRTHPRQIRAGRGFLKTGSFPRDDTHVVMLRLGYNHQLKVMVIPPETTTGSAERLMADAAAPTNRRTARELLACVQDREPESSWGRWTADGGPDAPPGSPIGSSATGSESGTSSGA